MSKMRMNHDAEALKLVEVAVDGRRMDVGKLGLDCCRELFDCPVTAAGKERTEQDAT